MQLNMFLDLSDALSKTVPIWCAVLNRLLFPDQVASHNLVRLPEIISDSEASQIEARLSRCVDEVKVIISQLFRSQAVTCDYSQKLELEVEGLREKVRRPLKAFWIARGLGLLPENVNQPRDDGVLPVYLCMSSEHHDQQSTSPDSTYVQGGGDDGENWSNGLTPQLFWDHQDRLLGAAEEELPDIIASITTAGREEQTLSAPNMVSVVPWMKLGVNNPQIQNVLPGCLSIVCVPSLLSESSEGVPGRTLRLKCGEGKLGSRNLRKELEKIPAFIWSEMTRDKVVTISCPTGKDISVGVALAVLCLFSDDYGKFQKPPLSKVNIDKVTIKKKLSWILTSSPGASPSRTTLNSVNSFLMKPV